MTLNVYAIIVYNVMQTLINVLAITFLTIIGTIVLGSVACYLYVVRRWDDE